VVSASGIPASKEGNEPKYIASHGTAKNKKILKAFKENINGIEFWMLPVPGSEYLIGDELQEVHWYSRKQTIVKVEPFYLCQVTVSEFLWEEVNRLSRVPDFFYRYKAHSVIPVAEVSWNEIQEFMLKIQNITRKAYRLPTDFEWEAAARATPLNDEKKLSTLYAGSDKCNEVAWTEENAFKQMRPVALKLPNAFGFYDMCGNTFEWCSDVGRLNKEERVTRGSAYYCEAAHSRIARVDSGPVDIGFIAQSFRLALSEL
jgi:formylglycine-generating enzyme required for sulfatase activity